MLFEKVKKEHILQAIIDFEEKGLPNEFGASSTYDVVFENKRYPPKALMAYANYHAEGRKIERYFKGGLNTDCFNAFKGNGFKIEKKKNVLIKYKEYEKEVYDWLNSKNEKDPNFTFSLRQNGSKGAELDYFIGTEKSRYFAVTFWTLPVGFPGSSGDCIGLVFKLSSDYKTYSYDFRLSQTNSPHDAQNTSALNLIKSATKAISDSVSAKYISDANNKMYTIRTKPKQEAYANLEDMLKDINEDLSQLIPIINNLIEEEKKVNSTFEAHRISKDEFDTMKARLAVRLDKYSDLKNKSSMELNIIDSLKEEFITYLEDSNYAKSTVKVYSDNFKICIQQYLKSNKISNFTKSDYKFLSEINIEKFLEKTKGEHEGKGFSNFKSFFWSKIKNIKTTISPTNQILYGPPGTGKTFYLKDNLFDKYTLKENAVTKEKYFEEIVSNLTWWQVIALALIEIGTAKVNGILENRWVAKKAALSESKNVRATLWGTLQMHTIIESKNVAYKQRQNPLIFDKTNEKTWQLLTDEVKEQSPEIYDVLKDVNNFELSPEKAIKNYDFVTFHQSFAYEDFIEGIKPISPEEGEESKDLGYKIEDGVFKKLCLKAKNDPNNRYAVFIDEINRGNVSAIFGELITLIELDKRKGTKNEISIKLPYSKTAFSVPSNVDIYGTMNTADRSVEALDTALRRRFDFKEMMPDYTVIQKEEVEGIKLSEVLETINQRIELLIDRDHTIGHSYFVNVDTLEKLANAFNNKIMPLLQEYFYGDYGKIGLVLGNGFVEIKKNDTIDFADFKYDSANDFKIASYELNQVDKNTVIDAVLKLIGKK